jgi:phosphate transport system protein
MSVHLQRQIDRLKKDIFSLGTQVEEAVRDATEAVRERDPEKARGVIDRDAEVDRLEIDIEEECLHGLALHQPVAMDLRYLVAVLKINSDLERIGDLAVNIAEQAQFLAHESRLEHPPFDLSAMSQRVRSMLKKSLDALVGLDGLMAQAVCEADDEVDQMHARAFDRVEHQIREDVEHLSQLMHQLNVSRQLERIADHTTNIAEDVLYMIEGDIFRHGHAQAREQRRQGSGPSGEHEAGG